jgi:hypothetical protein
MKRVASSGFAVVYMHVGFCFLSITRGKVRKNIVHLQCEKLVGPQAAWQGLEGLQLGGKQPPKSQDIEGHFCRTSQFIGPIKWQNRSSWQVAYFLSGFPSEG